MTCSCEINLNKDVDNGHIKEKVTYSVKFYDGEELLHTEIVEENTRVQSFETSKKGKTFEGWFTIDDVEFDFSTLINSDLNLYAKWEIEYGPLV